MQTLLDADPPSMQTPLLLECILVLQNMFSHKPQLRTLPEFSITSKIVRNYRTECRVHLLWQHNFFLFEYKWSLTLLSVLCWFLCETVWNFIYDQITLGQRSDRRLHSSEVKISKKINKLVLDGSFYLVPEECGILCEHLLWLRPCDAQFRFVQVSFYL